MVAPKEGGAASAGSQGGQRGRTNGAAPAAALRVAPQPPLPACNPRPLHTHLHVRTRAHARRAGDLGLEMYIIRKGTVGVIGKHNHVVGLLGVGEHFGEIALFTEVGVACDARVCARTTGRLLVHTCV